MALSHTYKEAHPTLSSAWPVAYPGLQAARMLAALTLLGLAGVSCARASDESGDDSADDSSSDSEADDDGNASGRNVNDPGNPGRKETEEARAAASPVAEQDLCSTFDLIVCDALQDCCTDAARKYVDRTECLSDINACTNGDLEALIGPERPYDAQAVGERLELFRRTTAECELPYPRLFFIAEEFSSEDALAGPTEILSTCGDSYVGCYPGTYCDRATESCVPTLAQGQDCAGDQMCNSGYFCRLAKPTASQQTCEPPGSEGDPCGSDRQCGDSLICRGRLEERTCLPPGPLGATCDTDGHCESGLCRDRQCSTCSINAECPDYDAACVDGACLNVRDVYGAFADGMRCEYHFNCQNGFCAAGVCLTPTANEIYCRAPE